MPFEDMLVRKLLYRSSFKALENHFLTNLFSENPFKESEIKPFIVVQLGVQ